MRKNGYNLRMWKNYACGRPFYAYRPDWTLDDMAVEKERLIKHFIPIEHHPAKRRKKNSEDQGAGRVSDPMYCSLDEPLARMVSIAELPKGYQTYKSKCLDKSNNGDTPHQRPRT